MEMLRKHIFNFSLVFCLCIRWCLANMLPLQQQHQNGTLHLILFNKNVFFCLFVDNLFLIKKQKIVFLACSVCAINYIVNFANFFLFSSPSDVFFYFLSFYCMHQIKFIWKLLLNFTFCSHTQKVQSTPKML